MPEAPPPEDFAARVADVHAALGLEAVHFAHRCLPLCPEARTLVVAERGALGRDYLLTPAAAGAWQRMKAVAAEQGVEIAIASAFRSLDHQARLVRTKLERGQCLDEILAVLAPPGYSEHHTGRAVDVSTPGCPLVDEGFEQTAAFVWLAAHAECFGFTLSYPRDNPWGYIYEPWHWCYTGDGATDETPT